MTLTVRYAGAGRSWYYPGRTALWVVGTPGAAAALNFEYQPPGAAPRHEPEREKSPSPPSWRNSTRPVPLPAWELRLPDWTCQHAGRSGKICGKTVGAAGAVAAAVGRTDTSGLARKAAAGARPGAVRATPPAGVQQDVERTLDRRIPGAERPAERQGRGAQPEKLRRGTPPEGQPRPCMEPTCET